MSVNESCFFNEQCEDSTPETECRDGRCICRFDKTPISKNDGSVECTGETVSAPATSENIFMEFYFFSDKRERHVAAQPSQPCDVFNSGCNGADVYHYLRGATIV